MQTTSSSLPLTKLDRFWARELGCAARDLRAGRVRLVPCGQRQVQILITPDGSVVIGQPALINPAKHATLDEILNPQFWCAQFKIKPFQLAYYGPSSLSYVHRRVFQPQTHKQVYRLQRRDAGELARFARILKAREPNIFHSWSIGGRVTANERIWGAKVNNRIVSVAGLRAVHKRLYEVGVNTLPRHRQRGWGTTVASATTEGGLMLGSLVQWSAPLHNEPSMRIANRLGYLPYAHQLWFSVPREVVAGVR